MTGFNSMQNFWYGMQLLGTICGLNLNCLTTGIEKVFY